MIFAYGPIDSPVYVWGIAMIGGFALLYAKDIPVRFGGAAICLSSLMMTAGSRQSDGEGWLFLAVLAIVFSVFRPQWLRRTNDSGESPDPTADRPQETGIKAARRE